MTVQQWTTQMQLSNHLIYYLHLECSYCDTQNSKITGEIDKRHLKNVVFTLVTTKISLTLMKMATDKPRTFQASH